MLMLPNLDGKESERLRYRKLTPADIDPWMEFHASEEAIRFFGYNLNDRGICEELFGKQLWRYSHNGSGLRAVLLKDSEELIGMCGLLTQDVNGSIEWEIGYRFIPRFWGNGYCTEAAIEHKDLVFRETDRKGLVSLIHPGNSASQAVAQRMGMERKEQAKWHAHDVDVWRVEHSNVL